MRTLVTGVAGCIGSDLAEALVARGDFVSGIDNLSSGKIEHLSGLRGRQNFRFIEGDLEDPAALEAAMQDAEFVWHLAANPETAAPRPKASSLLTVVLMPILAAASSSSGGRRSDSRAMTIRSSPDLSSSEKTQTVSTPRRL